MEIEKLNVKHSIKTKGMDAENDRLVDGWLGMNGQVDGLIP